MADESAESRPDGGRTIPSDLDRSPEDYAPSSTPLPEAPTGSGEPPSLSLMGRLFGVPLLIVGVMVGGALLVMLAFGDIAGESRRSVSSLLQSLESSSGEKVAGALFPRDRELWQDARELATRLSDRKEKLSPEEIDQVVTSLSGMLERQAQDTSRLSEMGRQRVQFFMSALSHTDSPKAIEPIVTRLSDPSPDTRREALIALGRMYDVPEVHDSLPRISATIDDSDSVVRTVACWAMSLLAKPDDKDVIAKLQRASFAEEREVSWNAALSLARLGDAHAKPVLLEMLDRGWWEQKVPVRVTAPNGEIVESPMPSGAVEQYLIATVDAAANLDDAELREAIVKLRSDPSPKVVERAMTAVGK